MQRQIQRCGRARTPIKDMLQNFMLSGKQKSEFLEAIKRLEKRHIIKIEGFRSPFQRSFPPPNSSLGRRKQKIRKVKIRLQELEKLDHQGAIQD
jgi:hypothetical protein